jgi:hypothetical protein
MFYIWGTKTMAGRLCITVLKQNKKSSSDEEPSAIYPFVSWCGYMHLLTIDPSNNNYFNYAYEYN